MDNYFINSQYTYAIVDRIIICFVVMKINRNSNSVSSTGQVVKLPTQPDNRMKKK